LKVPSYDLIIRHLTE